MKKPAKHIITGRKGEEIALDYLLERGYTVLETNRREGKTEIDIIALNTEFLIIIEVKTRTDTIFSEPAQSVTAAKQRNLIKAAHSYARRFNIEQDIRFDIITIVNHAGGPCIEHMKDAFYPV